MNDPKSNRWLLVFNYLSVYLGWGSTYLAIRFAVLENVSPAGFLGLRYLLAVLLLGALLFVIKSKQRMSFQLKEGLYASALGIALLGLATGLVAYSVRVVPSGITAIIIGCCPLLFAFFNRLFGGLKLTPPQIVGGILGLLGVWLLGFTHHSGISHPYALTDLRWVMVAAIVWALSSVASKKVHLPPHPIVSAMVQNAAAGLCLIVFGFLHQEFTMTSLFQMPSVAIKSMVYLAVVGSCLAYTSYNWLLKHEPANRVSTYAFVNPSIAVLLGMSLGKEHVNVNVMGALVLTSMGTMISLFGNRLKIRSLLFLRQKIK